MTDQHPITPPPKLVEQWYKEWLNCRYIGLEGYIATQAARWGADQELEECEKWLKANEWIHSEFNDDLRAARRPKPPSLKQQALTELDSLENMGACNADTIRRALEALPDD